MKWITLTALCLMSALAWAQTGTVTGTVTDATTGEPLVGANVYLKGARSGTVADLDGAFTLVAPAGDQEIIASYVGYAAVSRRITIAAGGKMSLNFSLAHTCLLSEEIVVSASRKAEKMTNDTATI